jgi:hypothetical protein
VRPSDIGAQEKQVQALFNRLIAVAKNPDQNIMPVTVEPVRAGATTGDIVEKLRGVWGLYREMPVSKPIAQRVAIADSNLDRGGRKARPSHGQASPLHTCL